MTIRRTVSVVDIVRSISVPLVACVVSSPNCWSDPFLCRRLYLFPCLLLPTFTLSRSFKEFFFTSSFLAGTLTYILTFFPSHHGPRTQHLWRTGAKELPNAHHTRRQHCFYGNAIAAVSSFLNDATMLWRRRQNLDDTHARIIPKNRFFREQTSPDGPLESHSPLR